MASVFFSYAHADESMRDQLEKQLAILKRQGVIETWHDRKIAVGREFAVEIDRHVETDDIVLLLVSPDFLASDYCYELEMQRAMERHEAGQAIVIPVILRACEWQQAPFGKLQATPTDGKPVKQWADIDQAFLEVAKSVRAAAERLGKRVDSAVSNSLKELPTPRSVTSDRSSNLRLAKQFSERDRDVFLHEAFSYMQRYFENSGEEIQRRNSGVDCTVRSVDANRFTAAIYLNGKAAARCSIYVGSSFGRGIQYSNSDSDRGNSFNESLSVDSDDQSLFLRSFGMAYLSGSDNRNQKLSMEGAAELYWGMFIRPLQSTR